LRVARGYALLATADHCNVAGPLYTPRGQRLAEETDGRAGPFGVQEVAGSNPVAPTNTQLEALEGRALPALGTAHSLFHAREAGGVLGLVNQGPLIQQDPDAVVAFRKASTTGR